jgi:hypothetical protein
MNVNTEIVDFTNESIDTLEKFTSEQLNSIATVNFTNQARIPMKTKTLEVSLNFGHTPQQLGMRLKNSAGFPLFARVSCLTLIWTPLVDYRDESGMEVAIAFMDNRTESRVKMQGMKFIATESFIGVLNMSNFVPVEELNKISLAIAVKGIGNSDYKLGHIIMKWMFEVVGTPYLLERVCFKPVSVPRAINEVNKQFNNLHNHFVLSKRAKLEREQSNLSSLLGVEEVNSLNIERFNQLRDKMENKEGETLKFIKDTTRTDSGVNIHIADNNTISINDGFRTRLPGFNK